MIRDTSAMDHALPRRRTVVRRIALAAGVLIVGAAAWFFLSPMIARWAGSDRAVDAASLRTAKVVVGDMDRDVVAQGRVVAALHPTLFSPAPGIVTLAVKAGAEIKKDQLLATIDSPALDSRLVQEQASLSSLQSELGRHQISARQGEVRGKQNLDVLTVRHEAADRSLKRYKKLFDEGVVPTSDVEKANDDLQIAALELKNARETAGLERETRAFETQTRKLAVERQASVVKELERQITELHILAPFDGIVAGVSVQDRDAVVENQPVVNVVNLSALEIELDLPENNAVDVVPGTQAEIAYSGKKTPGKVIAIAPEVRDNQVRGTVAFAGEPPAGLRQNERVTVRLVLDRRVKVMKLPRGPFLEAGGGRSVYVVEDGVARWRAVNTGVSSVSEVEILNGLVAGDQVIISDTSSFEGAHTVLLH